MKHRAAILLLLAGSVLAACSGGPNPIGSTIPVPDRPPSDKGVADGPAMVPKIVLTATDDLETLVSGDDSEAKLKRHAGAFVNGDIVVGYSVDDISGYDLESGDVLWTSDLDMEGGIVCFASQPDQVVKHFTVVYGDGNDCHMMATIRVSDGSVVRTNDLTDPHTSDGEVLDGAVYSMFTYDGTDFVIDGDDAVWNITADPIEQVTTFDGKRYADFAVTPEAPLLVATPFGHDPCAVDAYRLPSMDLAWSVTWDELFPDLADTDCYVAPTAGNPLWIFADSNPDDYTYLVQLDPKTGEVLGRDQHTADDPIPPVNGFSLPDAFDDAERTVGSVNGDLFFPQQFGTARRSLADPSRNWWTGNTIKLYEGANVFSQVSSMSAITADGRYVVGTISDGKDVEIIALDAEGGQLVGRWPLPEDFTNGFQVEPQLTLFNGGVVLTRNFTEWGYEYASEPEPEGDRYDIGVFSFPEPQEDE